VSTNIQFTTCNLLQDGSRGNLPVQYRSCTVPADPVHLSFMLSKEEKFQISNQWIQHHTGKRVRKHVFSRASRC